MRSEAEYDIAAKFIEAGLGHLYKKGQTMAVSNPQAVLRAKRGELRREKDKKVRIDAKIRRLEQEIEAMEAEVDPVNQISHLIWLKLMLAFDIDPLDGSFDGDEEDEDDVEEAIDALISKVKRGQFQKSDLRTLAWAYNLCVPQPDRAKLRDITEHVVEMVQDATRTAESE